MPEIDRLLPKPASEMSLQETLEFMGQVEAELTLWCNASEREKRTINRDMVLKALQCLSWGSEALRMLSQSVEQATVTPEYDHNEAVWFIHQRTDLPDDVIRKVLDADEAYMVDKGIIPKDEPDIPTLPGVQ